MHKNYYAIIPASVRYNDKLTPNAKLLYGEITALCNEKGFCWATNKYFSDLYKVSEVSISKWVSQLKGEAFIRTETDHEGKRKIYLIGDKEIFKKGLRKVKGGGKEKFKPNSNIYNIYNNTNNNSEKSKKEKNFVDFPKEVQGLFLNLDKLFDADLLPKTKEQKRKWVKTIDDLWRIDNYHPRKVYTIVERVKKDEFWNKQLLSIHKLRLRNKDQFKYIDYFSYKFAKDLKEVKFNKHPDV
jgi:hypothetical protein